MSLNSVVISCQSFKLIPTSSRRIRFKQMSKRTAIDEMMADRIIPPETDLSFILIVFKYCKILKFKFTNLIEQTQVSSC